MYLPRALAATLSSGVLVPLYINPIGGPDCPGWAPLLDTITAHASVPFFTIINPNSGPGLGGSQPGPEYQQCVPQLLGKPNVVVLGYVPTFEADAIHVDGVIVDVNTYDGWEAAYRPDGIFFDQVSGQPGDFGTYQSFTDRVRSLFSFVALNPGVEPVDSGYFGLADLLLTAENFFDDFSPAQLSLGCGLPSNPPTSLITQLISDDSIRAFYVTDDTQANNGNPYDNLPVDLESFVASLEAASA